MARRTRARVWITVAAGLIVAVALLLAYPRGASSAESAIIQASAPGSTDACSPCHPTPGTSRNPNVVYDHAAHLLVRCDVCHARPAHEGGTIDVPDMQVCFTCHGLQHGPSGLLASGECIDCHPATFELRPATHVEDWKGEPHAAASAGSVNDCLMCHNAPEDCDACHVEQRVDVGPMPIVYLSTLPVVVPQPEITIDTAAPVTMSQCAYCHPDINAFSVDGLIFTHDSHLERAYQCEACHPGFPHGPDGTVRAPMRDCYRCHGLEHGPQGQVADEACELCHTEGFELTPADHTVDFRSGEHKESALADPANCSQCHTSEDCIDCHRGGVEMANGETSEPVIPADHRKPQWSSEHGALYLSQEGMCALCHDSASCQQCHVTPMPHPATWLVGHAEQKDSLADDCVVCHQDREFCQECHHDSVRSVALIQENCVGCHEEMATEPETDIKVAGLAEHAVHFDVAEPDKNGEPYYCEDCHIGFGSVGVRVMGPASGPHDMRLCYECHGALDLQNVRIAPWPGSELCLRCHTDLNI